MADANASQQAPAGANNTGRSRGQGGAGGRGFHWRGRGGGRGGRGASAAAEQPNQGKNAPMFSRGAHGRGGRGGRGGHNSFTFQAPEEAPAYPQPAGNLSTAEEGDNVTGAPQSQDGGQVAKTAFADRRARFANATNQIHQIRDEYESHLDDLEERLEQSQNRCAELEEANRRLERATAEGAVEAINMRQEQMLEQLLRERADSASRATLQSENDYLRNDLVAMTQMKDEALRISDSIERNRDEALKRCQEAEDKLKELQSQTEHGGQGGRSTDSGAVRHHSHGTAGVKLYGSSDA